MYLRVNLSNDCYQPIPVAAQYKAWVCGHLLAGIVGLNGCLSLVSVMCCQAEVSVTSRSLVQRSPANSGASLCVI